MPLASIDLARYASQLAEKLAQFKLAFAPFAIPEPEVFPSAPEHYRLRERLQASGVLRGGMFQVNFLAPLFGRVLATEVNKSSVRAAHYNLTANRIDNVALVRASSQEISDVLAGRDEFKRMRDIDLADYRFSTLFVDPPRSGLDVTTLEFAAGFEHILHISCNPQTLQENLAALHASHSVRAAAVFDPFPCTDHLECGLLLIRR